MMMMIYDDDDDKKGNCQELNFLFLMNSDFSFQRSRVCHMSFT